MKKISIGISCCWLGQHVRYDGGHKTTLTVIGTLGHYFDFRLFYPEVEGLGIPRIPIYRIEHRPPGRPNRNLNGNK